MAGLQWAATHGDRWAPPRQVRQRRSTYTAASCFELLRPAAEEHPPPEEHPAQPPAVVVPTAGQLPVAGGGPSVFAASTAWDAAQRRPRLRNNPARLGSAPPEPSGGSGRAAGTAPRGAASPSRRARRATTAAASHRRSHKGQEAPPLPPPNRGGKRHAKQAKGAADPEERARIISALSMGHSPSPQFMGFSAGVGPWAPSGSAQQWSPPPSPGSEPQLLVSETVTLSCGTAVPHPGAAVSPRPATASRELPDLQQRSVPLLSGCSPTRAATALRRAGTANARRAAGARSKRTIESEHAWYWVGTTSDATSADWVTGTACCAAAVALLAAAARLSGARPVPAPPPQTAPLPLPPRRPSTCGVGFASLAHVVCLPQPDSLPDHPPGVTLRSSSGGQGDVCAMPFAGCALPPGAVECHYPFAAPCAPPVCVTLPQAPPAPLLGLRGRSFRANSAGPAARPSASHSADCLFRVSPRPSAPAAAALAAAAVAICGAEQSARAAAALAVAVAPSRHPQPHTRSPEEGPREDSEGAVRRPLVRRRSRRARPSGAAGAYKVLVMSQEPGRRACCAVEAAILLRAAARRDLALETPASGSTPRLKELLRAPFMPPGQRAQLLHRAQALGLVAAEDPSAAEGTRALMRAPALYRDLA
eukprot:TRINITY_DN2920_c3_g1_i1.p1 TRINITY_DN2920_c3_g1~~TRINITY_DN2920_c3_g1_i1.p1  ORF type:complete len:674 (+),score=112.65 TRINITY_DN2920_c3_g1_i1:79-2022(+)